MMDNHNLLSITSHPEILKTKELFEFNDVQQQMLKELRLALNSYLEAVIQTYTRIRKPYTKQKLMRHKIRLVSKQGISMFYITEYWVERKGVKLGQSFTIEFTSALWPNPEM